MPLEKKDKKEINSLSVGAHEYFFTKQIVKNFRDNKKMIKLRKSTVKKISLFLKIGISAGILSFLFYKIGFGSIVDTLSKTNLLLLPIIYLVLILSIFLGALNLKYLLHKVKVKIGTYSIFRCFMLNTALGWLLPGKVGGFSLPIILKREDIPLGTSSAVMIIDKIITLIFTIIVAAAGIFFFFGFIGTYKQVILLAAIAAIGIISIFSRKVRDVIKRVVPQKYAVKFQGFSKVLFDLLKHHPDAIILNISITVLKVIISGLYAMLIFLALGSYIPIHLLILIWGVEFAVSMIPITLSGLGLREAVGVYLFNLMGIDPSLVMGRYVIAWLMKYITSAAAILIYGRSKKEGVIKEAAADKRMY